MCNGHDQRFVIDSNTLDMVELPLTVYEQNNQKGIVVFATILLVMPFVISGLQLNHVRHHQMAILDTK